MIVYINRSSFDYIFGEYKKCHIRSAPRPIDREKSEQCGGNTPKMTIAMSHYLARFFRGGIQGKRVVSRVGFSEGNLRIGAVHRTRRSNHQVPRLYNSRQFENIKSTHQVCIDISPRI